MLPKPKLNVQSFPRPPLLEHTPRYLQIKCQNQVIADTKDAFWVLETYHSPTYYLPLKDISIELKKTQKSTFCEWKGWATYYSISLNGEEVKDRIWSYEDPTPRFKDLKGYVSFYVGPWDCFVDGEEVKSQPGDFYAGWTTSELEGVIKGSKETRWM
ncbi:hypothetical protein BJ878DRAFT_513704 [Calycina marina]|uniref:DUF427 domain-containing protein n=1 Tax=Calycina marina TaxID=1763456 RepID=A0A9P7Z0V6_9HELO|nr:hypothetical protein BJ878DRAFT_513704 [Calycina marina]